MTSYYSFLMWGLLVPYVGHELVLCFVIWDMVMCFFMWGMRFHNRANPDSSNVGPEVTMWTLGLGP